MFAYYNNINIINCVGSNLLKSNSSLTVTSVSSNPGSVSSALSPALTVGTIWDDDPTPPPAHQGGGSRTTTNYPKQSPLNMISNTSSSPFAPIDLSSG